MSERRVRVGISSCLLGEPVRWDGGHKRDPILVSELGRFVEWVPVCPEVEVGMGVPRPSVRLVREGKQIRMVENGTDRDHTRAMRAYARHRAVQLERQDLCGYVLKQDSPSCGMQGVSVSRIGASPVRDGRGLFAEALIEAMPWLPVEEERPLQDPLLREGFLERVFACRRLRDLFEGAWRLRDVVAFHDAHLLQLTTHSPKACAALGRLVSGAKRLPRGELRESYQAGFMAALAKRAQAGEARAQRAEGERSSRD